MDAITLLSCFLVFARTVSAFRPHHGHHGYLCEKETCSDAPHQYENEVTNPKRLVRQALYRPVAAIDCDNCEPRDKVVYTYYCARHTEPT